MTTSLVRTFAVAGVVEDARSAALAGQAANARGVG